MIASAIAVAFNAHNGQFRKGTDIPYIVHPIEAMTIVESMTQDEEVLSAAVLHDVVEDCGMTKEELVELFGERVASLVMAESEDRSMIGSAEETWRERKVAAIRRLNNEDDRNVLIIALADKLSNMRAIYKDYNEIGGAVWNKFNAGREDIGWYYREILFALWDLHDTEAWEELSKLINEVFY